MSRAAADSLASAGRTVTVCCAVRLASVLRRYGFVVYCVYKIIKCTVNIIFALDPKKDPITRGFELGLKVRGTRLQWAGGCRLRA